jgi:ABC-type multidrug transport system fused ATPase/permease subunit
MPDPAEPATPPVATFSRLLRMLRPQWRMILTGLGALLLSAPCELFHPLMWMYVADVIILGNDQWPILHTLVSLNGAIEGRFALLASALIWMFGVYALGELLQTIEQNLLGRVAQKFIFRLRNDVYHKLQGQSLGYLQRQRGGDLLSRAMGDVDEVQSFIVSGIDTIIAEGFMWITTVAIVMWLDWRVASVSLAPLVLVYALLRTFNRWIKPIYFAARQRAGDVAARLQENLSGVVVIKIFARETQEAERFEAATRAYYDQQIRAVNARSIYFPFARGVGFLSNVGMLGMAGYLILTNAGFTLGMLLAFRGYWWRLFGPIHTLARVNDMVQRAMAASRRVFEVLDAPDELPDAPQAQTLEQVRGRMQLHNVTFRYPMELGRPGPVVLEDVSLLIEPGRTIALCGPSGSGKSTVLNLLLRFYDPVEGAVILDGQDLRQIRRDSLRQHFSLVQQETFLFNDSILDNIRYGLPDATMEQVIAAAKAANAHGFISHLPAGYDTMVGERGIRLSGGQKQRISIARAFLANRSIILLDEPTSSVEPDSEAAIIAALDRLMTGRTTVLTSHRPSLINQADWVYVVENGRITEAGRPDQLAANGGWFGRFMRSTEQVEAADAEG